MSNRRKLKKAVKSDLGELFADCVALSMVAHDDSEKLQQVLADVTDAYHDFVPRISHVEPGLTPRVFFRKLRSDFAAKTAELSLAIGRA